MIFNILNFLYFMILSALFSVFTFLTEPITIRDLYPRVTSVTSYSASIQWNQLPDIPDNLKSHYGYILRVTDSMTHGIENISVSVDTDRLTVDNLEPQGNYSFLLQAFRKHNDTQEVTPVSMLINVTMPEISGKSESVNSMD